MKIKKLSLLVLSIIMFFYSLEIFCAKQNNSNKLLQESFFMQIYGEILGAYDDNLFWRLEGVYPCFEKEDYKIVCLSDSVSVMYGGHKEYPKMLEEQLAQSFPKKTFKVFNAGVPGYSSYQGYHYLKDELIKYKPDFVSINFGPNDRSKALNGLEDKNQIRCNLYLDKYLGWSSFYQCYSKWIFRIRQKIYTRHKSFKQRRVSKEDFKDNLINMIKVCKKNGSKAILLTSPYLDKGQSWIKIHQDYNNIIREVAFEQQTILIDVSTFFNNKDYLFIEPNCDHIHINLKGCSIIAQRLFDAVKSDIE